MTNNIETCEHGVQSKESQNVNCFSDDLIGDPNWRATLLEATCEGILVVDEAGLIQYANQHAGLLFGWKTSEMIGLGIESLMPPTCRKIHKSHRRTFAQHPTSRQMGTRRELPARTKDGKDFFVNVSLSPYSVGEKNLVICLISDITGSVMTEKQLELSEKRIDQLIDSYPVPTFVWQHQEDDFVLIRYNRVVQNYRQNALKMILGCRLQSIYPEGSRLSDGIHHCFQEKESTTNEIHRFPVLDFGDVRDLVITYLFLEPDLVFTIIDDITEKLASTHELQMLSNAVVQTADAVFITDRDGSIEYVNPAFEHMTGYQRSEVLGKNPRFLKSGKMGLEYYQVLWKTVLGGDPFQAQTINRRKDGSVLIVEQTITPIKDRNEDITHLVSVLKDMTERIRLQEKDTELRLAGQIQKQLFPVKPPQITGYDISGAIFPANENSGDYFDYFDMRKNTIGIVVADVSDHGMGPALLMAEVRAYLRSIARYVPDPRMILSDINRQIWPDFENTGYVTVFLARLDPVRNLLQCSNAGNYPAFVLNRDGMLLRELRTDGIPLGIFSKLNLSRSEPISLEPGDTVIFLTDGIPEAMNPAGNEFGRERMLSTIRCHLSEPAEKIIEMVRAEVQRFAGATVQADDQTIVICKRTV